MLHYNVIHIKVGLGTCSLAFMYHRYTIQVTCPILHTYLLTRLDSSNTISNRYFLSRPT